MLQRFGSVIRLKPEFEERYIILHKHTFPGVLKRIYASNIRNYSIFLLEGTLFSYYEYNGQDYEDDMRKIGEDPITQEWWKLTDPMQEPFKDRKEGEWWASMEEISHFSGSKPPDAPTQRFACMAEKESIQMQELNIQDNIINTTFIQEMTIFQKEYRLYLYCELSDTESPSKGRYTGERTVPLCTQISSGEQTIVWQNMLEVFHAD